MTETLLVTPKFTVERREYMIPGKGAVRRELVVHPGSVVILPLLAPDKVVMIQNYRFSVGQELLELPAGTLDRAEEPLHCAARELEEETGFVAGAIEPLCSFYTSPGITNELMHAFVATDLCATAQRLDETEQIRVQPMALPEALAAATNGRIVDGKTIAALLVYHYQTTRP